MSGRDSPSLLARYGIALAAIAVAIAVRGALTPWLGTTFPLATMFTAVAFVVWRAGGAGPRHRRSAAGSPPVSCFAAASITSAA